MDTYQNQEEDDREDDGSENTTSPRLALICRLDLKR